VQNLQAMFAFEGFADCSICIFMRYSFFDAHPRKWQAHNMSLDLQIRLNIEIFSS